MVTRFGARAALVVALSVGGLGAVALGLSMSPRALTGLIPGLIAVCIGDGIVFTTMFIAAERACPIASRGSRSALVSTASGIGAAVGLALLVLFANSGTEGLVGVDARRRAEGLGGAVFVVAFGVLLSLLVALNLESGASGPPAGGREHEK